MWHTKTDGTHVLVIMSPVRTAIEGEGSSFVLLTTERRKKFGSIWRVRRGKKNEKSREYRYVERQLRACSPACTVQQKNREGNQPSHFGRGLINQFQMGVPNGELVVMHTTSSYHMY